MARLVAAAMSRESKRPSTFCDMLEGMLAACRRAAQHSEKRDRVALLMLAGLLANDLARSGSEEGAAASGLTVGRGMYP